MPGEAIHPARPACLPETRCRPAPWAWRPTDPQARADLILRRAYLNAWSLQTQSSALIFTPDTTIDDTAGEEWAALGRRADQVLRRCTGEFDCTHIKGTPGCDLSYVSNRG